MKRLISFLLILAVALTSVSVDAKKRKTRKPTDKQTIVQPEPKNYDYIQGSNDGDITDEPKYPPEYPGGNDGLIKFLSENIKYPKTAQNKCIEGIVIIEFIIEKSGDISNIKVLKSAGKQLDREAVRVVKKIKHFIPGYDEDHAPVRTRYTLPVNFKLQ